jgi:predicted anti-sigma-YlaC factor YlaD
MSKQKHTREHNHENKDCGYLLGSLSEYVDGTLEEILCEEIERHVADCEDCRVVIDTLEKTVYLYHASAELEPPIVPDEVKERLYKRLDLDDFLNPS